MSDHESTPTADELEAQIERQRHELGETVDALSAKLDVKARSREKAQRARARVTDHVTRARDAATDEDGRPTQQAMIIGAVCAGAVVGIVVVVAWRRRS